MLVDTDKAKERLRRGGASEELAGSMIDVLRMLDEEVQEKLATKEDLKLMEERLKRELTATMHRTVWSGVAVLAALMTLFNYI